MKTFLVGIDDTDNLESRGTGYRVRQLALEAQRQGIAEIISISRHQLLVDPRIPYTSHNSSACLEFTSSNVNALYNFCKSFLAVESASGSDAGLCIIEKQHVNTSIRQWGQNAKKMVLQIQDAWELKSSVLFLEGITGTHIGVIGALAAIGLRAHGNDGRFLWLKGLREIQQGIYNADEVFKQIHVDVIQDKKGIQVSPREKILIGEWVRPVLLKNKITLLVEKETDIKEYEWKSVSKDYIKSIS